MSADEGKLYQRACHFYSKYVQKHVSILLIMLVRLAVSVSNKISQDYHAKHKPQTASGLGSYWLVERVQRLLKIIYIDILSAHPNPFNTKHSYFHHESSFCALRCYRVFGRQTEILQIQFYVYRQASLLYFTFLVGQFYTIQNCPTECGIILLSILVR